MICNQKPDINVSFKDFWFSKINLSQKYTYIEKYKIALDFMCAQWKFKKGNFNVGKLGIKFKPFLAFLCLINL